jgi:hypothetical protein
MSCCGQKRERVAAETGRPTNFTVHHAVKSRIMPVRPTLATGAVSPPPDRNLAVTLRYRSRSALIVLGSTTGKRYQFTGQGSMQAVDRRDAEALVASGLFERIWVDGRDR